MTAKRYLWILFVFFALAGCDDLEDTYSDYAGDGQIRYLTKCSDVKIVPGWEKLNMNGKIVLIPWWIVLELLGHWIKIPKK